MIVNKPGGLGPVSALTLAPAAGLGRLKCRGKEFGVKSLKLLWKGWREESVGGTETRIPFTIEEEG